MRRQMSSDVGVVLSDADSASDLGDDADLLLDATLTSDALRDFAAHVEHDPTNTSPTVPNSVSLESAE